MKWGILASGTIAAKFARTVNAMSGETEVLVAVGSRSAQKAQKFADEHDIPKAYGSYEELAADPEVEAVYIATPNNLHYENALLCLNAGKHVLCEKPFTTNAGGAPYTVECPPDVNGFEYEIREVSRCVRAGLSHSDIFRPEDSVAVLRLMDEIRESWDMKFTFEK